MGCGNVPIARNERHSVQLGVDATGETREVVASRFFESLSLSRCVLCHQRLPATVCHVHNDLRKRPGSGAATLRKRPISVSLASQGLQRASLVQVR
jgi:hypothetical protein